MKIVDADWELRNLGCKTVEITLEKSDRGKTLDALCEELEQEIRVHEARYVVVKVDTRYSDISLRLQHEGYDLIEVQAINRLTREAAEQAIKRFAPFVEGVGYRAAAPEDVDMVVREVKKGIFTTDRIALDPQFGIEVANLRYANWILDEVARGTVLYLATYNDTPIGFFINRKKERGRVQGLLTGLFTDEAVQGFGSLLDYASYQEMLDHGMRVLEGGVSMNNPRVVQIHQAYGQITARLLNVFIKHR